MPITLADITSGSVDGAGVFDTLMKASKAHLEAEYKANRIKGDKYADVYLGMMTNNLNQAVQFILTKDQSAKQIELIDAQILKTQEETDLVFQQKTNLIAEAANIPLEGQRLTAQKNLVDAQKLKVDSEILLLGSQKSNLDLEGINIPKQGTLLDAQAGKTNADTAVAQQQVTNMTAEKLLIDARTGHIAKQETKIDSEIALLDQKKKSEEAQIKDTVDAVTVAGVIGKQKTLYQAQTDGFARDAEHKAAKLMVDVWSVQRTTDEGIQPAGAGLSDAEIKKVVDAMKSGVGVTPG